MTQSHSNLAQRLHEATTCLPLDAKRKPSKGKGVESWYPYYAGYTEEFARGVLRGLGDGSVLRVLDPWNGSGTTTRVAHEMGHHAIGFDINPVANLVASAKMAHADDALHVAGLARRLASAPAVRVDLSDPLLTWMASSVVGQYRAIEGAILAELATTSDGNVAHPRSRAMPPLAAFMLLALIRAARNVASLHTGTNPTWTTPGEGRHRVVRTLGKQWVKQVSAMAQELATARTAGSVVTSWPGQISIADAKALPLANGQIDLILTSPPYCTRIDYIVSSSFELAALGVRRESSDFKALRLGSMGTPLARQGAPPEIPSDWPIIVRDLLTNIRNHPSKASRSYYYKTFWQYFADAQAALTEFRRVLRPGGLALLVVQTSYYKEMCVNLPSLYVQMGNNLGLKGAIVGETAVQRALAQIHPHSIHHRKESLYKEAVIGLEKAA